MPSRNLLRFVAGVLGIALLTSGLSMFIAITTARLDIQNQLTEQLPDRLAEALQYSFADREVFAHVDQQISNDLALIQIDGLLPVLEACHTRLIRLSQHAPVSVNADNSSRTISVDWQRGNDIDQAEFTLDCQINVPALIGANVVIALLLMSAWWLLPAPLGADQQQLNDDLQANGIPPAVIQQALQKSDPVQLPRLVGNPWFLLAMRPVVRAEIDLDAAFAIAASAPTAVFHHNSHRVVIHGISIVLPKTPYFYYAWYALQRKQNTLDGWILNPAINRPDRRQATALIALMENYGGHQKAINDLMEHGLRSKILDQNRNKIKEELVAALGEVLAAGFLFETERDSRSSRYRYRFCCPPEHIVLTNTTT